MELQKPMQLSLTGWEKFLGDSIEVLQAVDTGGVFYDCLGIPFLEEQEQRIEQTDRRKCDIHHFEVKQNSKWIQFSIFAKFLYYYSLHVLVIINLATISAKIESDTVNSLTFTT